MPNRNDSSTLVVLVIVILVGYAIVHRDGSSSSSGSSTASDDNRDDDDETITRQEAIDNHWDEIRDYLDGSASLTACGPNGSCYEVESDISSGTIDTITFSSGHALNFSADIEDDGSASDTDLDGDPWTFDFDMSSSLVDDAIAEWANATDHTVVE